MAAPVKKICIVCGANVAGSKRVKDTQGRYYCQGCWNDKSTQRSAPSPAASPVLQGILIPPSSAPASAPSVDIPPIAADRHFPCSGCGRSIPENEVNYSAAGDYLCDRCVPQAAPYDVATPASQDGLAPVVATPTVRYERMSQAERDAKKKSSDSGSSTWYWGGGGTGLAILLIILGGIRGINRHWNRQRLNSENRNSSQVDDFARRNQEMLDRSAELQRQQNARIEQGTQRIMEEQRQRLEQVEETRKRQEESQKRMAEDARRRQIADDEQRLKLAEETRQRNNAAIMEQQRRLTEEAQQRHAALMEQQKRQAEEARQRQAQQMEEMKRRMDAIRPRR